LVASSSVSVAITAPRYSRRHVNIFADYWPHRPYKRVEWWSKGKQVIDRDEILVLLAGETEETRNAVAQFFEDERRRSAVTEIRVIDDTVELDGVPVARLVPGLRPSLRDELIWAFDSLDEDYIALLEDRIAKLEEQLKAPAR
jgi:hypothetical protein